MAPHDTNTPKEAKRHAVPLIVMAIILASVGIGLVWFIGAETEDAGGVEPGAAEQFEQAD